MKFGRIINTADVSHVLLTMHGHNTFALANSALYNDLFIVYLIFGRGNNMTYNQRRERFYKGLEFRDRQFDILISRRLDEV